METTWGKDRKDEEDDDMTKVQSEEKVRDGYVFGVKYTNATVSTLYLFLSMCMFMTLMALPNMHEY